MRKSKHREVDVLSRSLSKSVVRLGYKPGCLTSGLEVRKSLFPITLTVMSLKVHENK